MFFKKKQIRKTGKVFLKSGEVLEVEWNIFNITDSFFLLKDKNECTKLILPLDSFKRFESETEIIA